MKKFILFVCTVAAMISFNSCDPGDSDYHAFQFMYPTNAPYVYQFGDQTVDTIGIFTTESYTASVEGNSSEWLAITYGSSATVKPGYQATAPLFLAMKPNTTGKTRVGYIKIATTSDWKNEIRVMVTQMPWHYVGWPQPVYSKDYTTCNIERTDSATQKSDFISFKAFDNWQIEVKDSANSFIHLHKLSGTAGINKVEFNMDNNTSRTDTLRGTVLLKSNNGVTTEIKINKAPVKK